MSEIETGTILHAAREGRDRNNYFGRVVAVDAEGVVVQPQRTRSVSDPSVRYPDYGWDWPDGDEFVGADPLLRYSPWDGEGGGYRYA